MTAQMVDLRIACWRSGADAASRTAARRPARHLVRGRRRRPGRPVAGVGQVVKDRGGRREHAVSYVAAPSPTSRAGRPAPCAAPSRRRSRRGRSSEAEQPLTGVAMIFTTGRRSSTWRISANSSMQARASLIPPSAVFRSPDFSAESRIESALLLSAPTCSSKSSPRAVSSAAFAFARASARWSS